MLTGRCRCGQLRYEIAAETIPPIYACHCLDCQRCSGSAFAEHFLTQEYLLKVDGRVATWEHENATGVRSVQSFCAECFTRVFNTTLGAPGAAVVRAGTLDDSDVLSPIVHIWVSRKQPWVVIPAGVTQLADDAGSGRIRRWSRRSSAAIVPRTTHL